MKIMKQLTSALAISMVCFGSVSASDTEDLTAMLQDFLAAAHKEAAHASFWAEDLVYTSSDGSRIDKATIMAGFDGTESSDEPPAMVYSGEEIDIRVYGDTAIVAFKLVGKPTNESAGSDVLYFFNTGTLLKRDGVWQVVAWQATKIPPP